MTTEVADVCFLCWEFWVALLSAYTEGKVSFCVTGA